MPRADKCPELIGAQSVLSQNVLSNKDLNQLKLIGTQGEVPRDLAWLLTRQNPHTGPDMCPELISAQSYEDPLLKNCKVKQSKA